MISLKVWFHSHYLEDSFLESIMDEHEDFWKANTLKSKKSNSRSRFSMMRKNSLSPTKLEYGNDSLVHINSQLSNNSDLLNLIPIGSNKSIQIDETQRENETLTLEKRNSCISISKHWLTIVDESYYDKRDSRLNSFSKKDESTRINRAHSLQKVSKDRNQSKGFALMHRPEF